MGYIINNYAEGLGCDSRCVENNRIASVVLLGTAAVLLHIVPLLLKDVATMLEDSEDFSHGQAYYMLDMFAILVRIDTTYTIVVTMAETTAYCGLTDESLGWAFFVIFTVIGIAGLIVTSIYAAYKMKHKHSMESKSALVIVMVLAVIFLSISLPLYIIADNQQPLDCAWGCDFHADNATLTATSSVFECNFKGNSVTRLAFMLVTGLLVLSSLGTLAIDWKIEGVI